jgi:preprotein translocase subunit YajC
MIRRQNKELARQRQMIAEYEEGDAVLYDF